MLTKPVDALFSRLTVKVNGGPNPDAMDSFPVSLAFDSFALDALDDSDIDAIVQVIVGRIRTDQPDYTVTVARSWTGAHNEPFETVYTPPETPQQSE